MSFELRRRSEIDEVSRTLVLEVVGEVDSITTDDFEEQVGEMADGGPVILDMSTVTYLSSSAFAAIDRLIGRDVMVVIADDSPVRRAAALMGVPSFRSVVEARASRADAG